MASPRSRRSQSARRLRSARALAPWVVVATIASCGGGHRLKPTDTLIVPQRSIAGITVGMPTAQIKAELGAPSKKADMSYGGRLKTGELDYPYLTITTSGPEHRVDGVITQSPVLRTRGGNGVGSTVSSLRREFPNIACQSKPLDQCVIGRIKNIDFGGVFTLFDIDPSTNRVYFVQLQGAVGGRAYTSAQPQWGHVKQLLAPTLARLKTEASMLRKAVSCYPATASQACVNAVTAAGTAVATDASKVGSIAYDLPDPKTSWQRQIERLATSSSDMLDNAGLDYAGSVTDYDRARLRKEWQQAGQEFGAGSSALTALRQALARGPSGAAARSSTPRARPGKVKSPALASGAQRFAEDLFRLIYDRRGRQAWSALVSSQRVRVPEPALQFCLNNYPPRGKLLDVRGIEAVPRSSTAERGAWLVSLTTQVKIGNRGYEGSVMMMVYRQSDGWRWAISPNDYRLLEAKHLCPVLLPLK